MGRIRLGRKLNAWKVREFTPCCVLHPHGNRRFALDCAGLAFILYDCFVTPMILSFDQFAEPRTLATMATIFWTLEMLSSFSTAYHKEDSLLVTNRCLIALRQ